MVRCTPSHAQGPSAFSSYQCVCLDMCPWAALAAAPRLGPRAMRCQAARHGAVAGAAALQQSIHERRIPTPGHLRDSDRPSGLGLTACKRRREDSRAERSGKALDLCARDAGRRQHDAEGAGGRQGAAGLSGPDRSSPCWPPAARRSPQRVGPRNGSADRAPEDGSQAGATSGGGPARASPRCSSGCSGAGGRSGSGPRHPEGLPEGAERQ